MINNLSAVVPPGDATPLAVLGSTHAQLLVQQQHPCGHLSWGALVLAVGGSEMTFSFFQRMTSGTAPQFWPMLLMNLSWLDMSTMETLKFLV